ncbi:redoxin domain-containing protein [Candidatus Sumerlaeota bacterium]|nr:redoxin domain-containing protein [Candidatus Sumerlaeota bacterium]
MIRTSLTLSLALLALPLAMAQDLPTLSPGDQAPDFALPNILDPEGAVVSLADVLAESELAVVVWHSIECPWVRPYDEDLPAMAAECAEQGVAFIGINSNVTESDEDVAAFLGDFEMGAMPMLRDEGNTVADAYGALRTPEVFVVDSDQTIRFHGRIDDRGRGEAQNHDLRNALSALLAGEEPAVTETIARGCTIKRVGM